jgi:hypothetical protein
MFRKPVPHDVAVPQHPHFAYGAAARMKKWRKIEILTSELVSSLFKGLVWNTYMLWTGWHQGTQFGICSVFFVKALPLLACFGCFAWKWRSRIILSSNSWMGYLTRTLLCNSPCAGASGSLRWICPNYLKWCWISLSAIDATQTLFWKRCPLDIQIRYTYLVTKEKWCPLYFF